MSAVSAGVGVSGCYQTRTSASDLPGKVFFQGQIVFLSCSVFVLAAGGITVSL